MTTITCTNPNAAGLPMYPLGDVEHASNETHTHPRADYPDSTFSRWPCSGSLDPKDVAIVMLMDAVEALDEFMPRDHIFARRAQEKASDAMHAARQLGIRGNY